jgi:ClpP class serine protease
MSGHLLISPEGARAYRAARLASASVEQLEQFAARATAAQSGGMPRIMQTVNGVVEISVFGVLTEAPDFFAQYFGGGNTTFSDIRTALHLASADPAVREVVLSINSPGGTVAGLFETLDVLEAFTKPLRAEASMACSAAYALAAMCDSIQAKTRASAFGSVGVAVALFVDDSVIDITNKESPDKRPDVTTPEGVATIQRELDAIFELFAGAIARGRGVSTERVTSDFGRGATLLTAAALRSGMIDGQVAPAAALSAAASKAAAAGALGAPSALAELLATRLPEESAEAYIRRCGALLERAALPAAAPAPSAPRESLETAVVRVAGEMPAAFAGAAPERANELAAALSALDEPEAVVEGEVTIQALTEAIQGLPKAATAAPSARDLADALERMSP